MQVVADVEGQQCRLHSTLGENNTTSTKPLASLGGLLAHGRVHTGSTASPRPPLVLEPNQNGAAFGPSCPCQLLAHPLMEPSSLVVTPLGKVDFSPSSPPLQYQLHSFSSHCSDWPILYKHWNPVSCHLM
ncbi:hypothetical protein QBC45DRAFT_411320 [Copromyces sp. CBS 386.78]|nr:hypothetical protein QBC45DRAFT_411320 [Copromyces sp. CBS 386.78]